MANEITAQHAKALDLHNRIMVSAQLVQTNLWDMCNGLKEMRDGKLYKELGYQNFEDYCSEEFNISRMQAHKYISIIENCNSENVNSSLHFGVTKLYLLSTLSEADQEKITAENDVGKQTVKELEEKIKELRQTNSELNTELDEYDDKMAQLRAKAADDLKEADRELSRLREENQELRSRPIEATVTETTDEVRQLKETIKNIEISTEQQMKQMEEEHVADIRELHEKNRAETQKQLDAQKAEYEEKIRRAAESTALTASASQDDKQVFKAYYSAAYDAFKRMIDFAANADDIPFFRGKIHNLLDAFRAWNENM